MQTLPTTTIFYLHLALSNYQLNLYQVSVQVFHFFFALYPLAFFIEDSISHSSFFQSLISHFHSFFTFYLNYLLLVPFLSLSLELFTTALNQVLFIPFNFRLLHRLRVILEFYAMECKQGSFILNYSRKTFFLWVPLSYPFYPSQTMA